MTAPPASPRRRTRATDPSHRRRHPDRAVMTIAFTPSLSQPLGTRTIVLGTSFGDASTPFLVELACRAPPDRSSPFVIPAQHDGGAGARRCACREQRDHVILKPGDRMAISDIVTDI